jgi:hypothetical protein
MASTIYGTEGDRPNWDGPHAAGSGDQPNIFSTYLPWPRAGAVQAEYLNKCIDGITGEWTFWRTHFQDRDGVYYIVNGGQQFDSATYKVETIVHGREQI